MPDNAASQAGAQKGAAQKTGQEKVVQQLPGVDHIVAVSSAKGGVGKSTVAVNLAAAMAARGLRVGFADLDIYGPSAPVMLGLLERPRPEGELVKPLQVHGMKVISMGFFLDEDSPVLWRGPLVMSATRQFLRGVAWGELDCLVLDMPPGTGDIQLTVAQEVPIDGVVIVTTPQDLALADVARGVSLLNRLNAPMLGVVQNMSGIVCSDCGHVDPVFGERGAEQTARTLGVPLLAELPLEPEVCQSGDAGVPLVISHPESEVAGRFVALADKVGELLEAGPELRGPQPASVEHDNDSGLLTIAWQDGSSNSYLLEGLRGWCPCAQCQGHSNEVTFVAGGVTRLEGIEGVGRYALRLRWADGHDTGMYSFDYLKELVDYAECQS